MTELVDLQKRIEKLSAILGIASQPLRPEPYFDRHELSIATKAFISGNPLKKMLSGSGEYERIKKKRQRIFAAIRQYCLKASE
jgi:hypothetical protein